MSTCDGCGEPIGHTTGIEGEYHQFDERDKRNKFFGSTECKEIYEDAKGIVEKIECDKCGDLVVKSEAVEGYTVVSGINCKQRYCPDCAKKESEDAKEKSTGEGGSSE